MPPCDRESDMHVDCDDDAGSAYADHDVAWEDYEEDEADNAWESPPSVESLRSRWVQECRAVKALERVEWDSDNPSAALGAARAARDRAEQNWRAALAPKPVALRMGNAQRKLDKAQRAVEKAERELSQFEAEAQARREELQAEVEAAEQRRQNRQKQLDALHKEAGELAAANAACGGHEREAQPTAVVVQDVIQELQAFVETLDEGSDARGKANLLLAKLATAPHAAPSRHYICSDAEEDDDGGDYQAVSRRGRARQATSPARPPPRREPAWCEGSNGRWNKHKGTIGHTGQRDRDTDVHMGGGDNGAEAAAAAAPAGAADSRGNGSSAPVGEVGAAAAPAGPANASAGRNGPGADGSRPGKGRQGPRDEDAALPPNKSHRGHDETAVESTSVESAGDDAMRALKLRSEQEAAIQAAREANAKFGDSTSMHIAAQVYAHKVEQAKTRAKAVGIEPVSEGRQLIELPPDAFNKWVNEVLVPAESQKGSEDREL